MEQIVTDVSGLLPLLTQAILSKNLAKDTS